MSRSSPVITETIPFMDDRNTPRPSKKPLSTTPQRASTPTKRPSPPSRKGAVQQNGAKSEELQTGAKQQLGAKTENKSSPRPGTASARAAMVSAPNSAPPKKKSPESDPSPSSSTNIDKSKVPAYTPRNKSFRPKPRPTKGKAPQPPSAPVSPSSSKPFQPKITASKNSPKTETTPTRNVIKPPPKSFSVDPLDIARNYPLQAPRPSRSSNPITSTSIEPVAPPPLASPDVEFANMSLEIGPDLSPTFSFDRETSSGEKLITFKDNLNARTDFDQLSKLLETLLDEEEKKCMGDLKQYLVKNEEAWILDQKLLNFVGALLENRSLDTMVRVKVLRLLAAGALRHDFWSFLQLDRKDRQLMKFPNHFDNLSVEEQKAVAMFLCNCFSSCKITSKVAAFSLVSYTPSLQDLGSAIIYNIALKEAKGTSVPVAQYTAEGLPNINLDYKEVSDSEIIQNGSKEHKFVTLKVYNEVAIELCMACLKFIKKTQKPTEEILFRCVKSLLKFSLILKGDLLTCIAMVQCDLDSTVPGHSDRIDKLWNQLRQQLLNNSEDI